jgi:hypothetical protein
MSTRPPVHLSVCLSAWYNSAPNWRIFMKFYIWVFFETVPRNLKFRHNPKGIMGTLVILSRWIILIMRNVSDKLVQKIKTQVSCSITIFRKLCCLWYNVENMVESDSSLMAIQDGTQTVRFASWIPQATNTHPEYVILTGFFTAPPTARTRLMPIVLCLFLSIKDVAIKTYSVYQWSRIGRTGTLMNRLVKQVIGSTYTRWTVIWTQTLTPCRPSWDATNPSAIQETPHKCITARIRAHQSSLSCVR